VSDGRDLSAFGAIRGVLFPCRPIVAELISHLPDVDSRSQLVFGREEDMLELFPPFFLCTDL